MWVCERAAKQEPSKSVAFGVYRYLVADMLESARFAAVTFPTLESKANALSLGWTFSHWTSFMFEFARISIAAATRSIKEGARQQLWRQVPAA